MLPVMLFHAGVRTFEGGFVGVDVFFVISGYLITRVIVADKRAGRFSLAEFYERRARRILPALLFVSLVCVPVAWWVLPPSHLREFSRSLVSVSAFLSNVHFWMTTGYFDTATELRALVHTWSLSVEEQYYVLFPAFVVLVWGAGERWLLTMLAACASVSLGLAQWGSSAHPEPTFYLLPTRGWELLIGAIAALRGDRAATSFTRRTGSLLSATGMALVVYAVLAFDDTTPFPSLYALVPTVGTALILMFGTATTPVGRLLSTAPFVGVGLISYSAYLWHQPLFAFARHGARDAVPTSGFVVLAGVALVLAYFSWRHVERPFRDRRWLTRRTVFGLSIAGSAALAIIGAVGVYANGFEEHYRTHRLNAADRRIFDTLATATRQRMRMEDDGECRFAAAAVDEAFTTRFLACARTHGKAVVVLGDSHAMNLYNALYRGRFAPFVVGVARGGCRPDDDFPTCDYGGFDAFARRHAAAIDYVAFHQAGSYLIRDHRGQRGTEEPYLPGGRYAVAADSLEKIAEYLDQLSTAVSVTWIGPFAEARVDFDKYWKFRAGYEMNPIALEAFEDLEQQLQSFARTRLRVRYVSLADAIDIDRTFLMVGDCLTYRNADHFSECGEQIVGERLKAAFGGASGWRP